MINALFVNCLHNPLFDHHARYLLLDSLRKMIMGTFNCNLPNREQRNFLLNLDRFHLPNDEAIKLPV